MISISRYRYHLLRCSIILIWRGLRGDGTDPGQRDGQPCQTAHQVIFPLPHDLGIATLVARFSTCRSHARGARRATPPAPRSALSRTSKNGKSGDLHSSNLTMADLAELAGLSKITVSRALSDSSLVNRETCERIKGLAFELC